MENIKKQNRANLVFINIVWNCIDSIKIDK